MERQVPREGSYTLVLTITYGYFCVYVYHSDIGRKIMFIISSKTVTLTGYDLFIPTKHNQNIHSFKNFKVSLHLINISNRSGTTYVTILRHSFYLLNIEKTVIESQECFKVIPQK